MTSSTPLSARPRPLFFRKTQDVILRIFSLFSIVLALSGMGWIIYTLFTNGWNALSWEFLTENSKPYGVPGPSGIWNALLGTLYITFGAVVVAVPPALAAGIYMSEFGKGTRVANILRFCANVMMGLPSIIVGLFVYVLIVIPTGQFSGFAGTIALAIIMFPVIMRTTEDMLAMVPDSLRESGLALGMTRIRTTLCIVSRSAKNGLATGVLLSLARVSGETAPLLFTAMFADRLPTMGSYMSEPTANVPVLISEYTMNSPFEVMHNAGWGAALIISAFILLVNIGTRYLFRDKH